MPLSAFGIYWALALLYVGGSRFVARYLFLHTGDEWQGRRRAWRSTAPAMPARASVRCCSAVRTSSRSPSSTTRSRCRAAASTACASTTPTRCREAGAAAPHRPGAAGDAGRHAPAPARDPRRSSSRSGVHVQSLPNLSDLISGKAQINELCDVDVGDLLGRDPVPPKPTAVRLVHPRQVRAGHRRRRLDRLGAVPADHAPEPEPAGAVRDVGARALQHRARARRGRRARAA